MIHKMRKVMSKVRHSERESVISSDCIVLLAAERWRGRCFARAVGTELHCNPQGVVWGGRGRNNVQVCYDVSGVIVCQHVNHSVVVLVTSSLLLACPVI